MKNEIKNRIIFDVSRILSEIASRLDIGISDEGVLSRIDLPADLGILQAAAAAAKKDAHDPEGFAFGYFEDLGPVIQKLRTLDAVLNGWGASLAVVGGKVNPQIMEAALHILDLRERAKRHAEVR